MRGLIRFLLDVEAASKVLDRLSRSRQSTWIVPTAAVLVAGGMFWSAARYNLAQQLEPVRMSPQASHTILGNIAGPVAAASANYALRFEGGVATDSANRVKIRNHPVTDTIGSAPSDSAFAGDFTVELWLRFDELNVNTTNATCNDASHTDWTTSDALFDKNRFSQNPSFGIAVQDGGTITAGFRDNSGNEASVCGSTDLGDNVWHHVAVERDISTGDVMLYVDGALDDSVPASITATMQYPDDGVPGSFCGPLGNSPCTNSDPFIVLGAEKHNASGAFHFTGDMDELRISNVLRYTAPTYTVPTEPFTSDASTKGLYSFDENTDTITADDTGLTCAAIYNTLEPPCQEGALVVERSGGSAPTWIDATWEAPADLVFASSWTSGTGTTNFVVLDSSRARPWPSIGNMNGEVFTDAAGDFPSGTYIETSGNMYVEEDAGYWTAPGIGEYITYRFGMVWAAGGTFNPAISLPSHINDDTNEPQFFTATDLSSDVYYEFQVRTRVVGTDTIDLDAVILDAAGDTVFSNVDWVNWNVPIQGNDNMDEYGDFALEAGAGARLSGLTFGLGEAIAVGDQQHPFHPTDFLTSPFGSTPWGWHFQPSQNDDGDGLRFCCISVVTGTTSESVWPLPPWNIAEEAWSPN